MEINLPKGTSLQTQKLTGRALIFVLISYHQYYLVPQSLSPQFNNVQRLSCQRDNPIFRNDKKRVVQEQKKPHYISHLNVLLLSSWDARHIKILFLPEVRRDTCNSEVTKERKLTRPGYLGILSRRYASNATVPLAKMAERGFRNGFPPSCRDLEKETSAFDSPATYHVFL